ncbi:MAG: hypothetical protein GX793_10380 [Bacteroidales bacterium]|nr:hypothetical protein [Bacteroidales bacterium]
MKKYCLALVFLAFTLVNTYSQVIAPRVYVKDFQLVNTKLEIEYGFENCNPAKKYNVWIEIHKSNGEVLKPKDIYGDVSMVKPDNDRKIVIDLKKNAISLDEDIKIKLFANQVFESKPGKAIIKSTIFPGLGHKQLGGKNKPYLGVIAYAGIGSSLALNYLAVQNITLSQDATTTDENMYLNKAKIFNAASLTSLGIGVGMWALDYFLLTKTNKKVKNLAPGEFLYSPPKNSLIATTSSSKFISTRGLPPNLFAELAFKDDNDNGVLESMENAEILIKVTNHGKGEAFDLIVKINDDKNDKSLKIGKIEPIAMLKPEESKLISIPLSSDINLKTDIHKLSINVMEKFGYDMDPAYLVLQTYEFAKPNLVFSGLEIYDSGKETMSIIEDGQLQAGESVITKIVVQNIGQGISKDTRYNVFSTDNNIFLKDNSGNLGNIQPGETKEIYISLSPNKRVDTEDNLPIYISLTESLNKGSLKDYQLPIKLNQKPPETNILTINADIESLTKNITRFEYSSKKFSTSSNIINIKSVLPSQTKIKNSIGVVFGVAKYKNMPPAPYADNDAKIMKEYFEKILGVEQVLMFTNEEVLISKLHEFFNPQYGELKKAVVKDETEVFVYFSGHGVPDKSGENTYLFPYDGIKEDLERFGYNTSELYKNLSELEAKNVTVILDACFSGGSRKTGSIPEENLVAQKGVRIVPKQPWINDPKFTIISSSTGEETSLGFDNTESGLFTYYLCAGLQGKADENQDGKISFKELENYVKNNVIEHSIKISGKQTPEFSGEDRIIVEF